MTGDTGSGGHGHDLAALLEEALERSGLEIKDLAQKLADARHSNPKTQRRQIRRWQQGRRPTQDSARVLARAFAPELVLPDDYFFSGPTTITLLHAEIAELSARVARLEADFQLLQAAVQDRTTDSQSTPGDQP